MEFSLFKAIKSLAQRPIVYRSALIVYVLCTVGVISVYFWVSNRQVRYAGYFQSADVLDSGAPSAVRGVLMYAPTGEFLPDAALEIDLIDSFSGGNAELARRVQVGKGQARAGGLIHTQLHLPDDWPAGPYELEFRASDTSGGESVARGQVELVHTDTHNTAFVWPTEISRRKESTDQTPQENVARDLAEDGVKVRVDVFPGSREIVRGLHNVIFLRISDAQTGVPWVGRLQYKDKKGITESPLPDELQSDRLGIARLELVPVTDQQWKFEFHSDDASPGDGNPEELKIELSTVPAQFSLQMRDLVASHGSAVDGVVHSLYRSGGFFVDLYDSRHWLESAVFGLRDGQSGLRVTLPDAGQDAIKLHRVQVYQSLYNPGHAWDSTYVVGLDTSTGQVEARAARFVLQQLAEHMPSDPYFQWVLTHGLLEQVDVTPAEYRRWLEAFLKALPQAFEPPPVLINTQQADREQLQQWREDVQARLMLYAVFVFGFGIVMLLLFVAQGVLRAQAHARMLQEADDELLDGDSDVEDVLARQRMAQAQTIAVAAQGAVVVITIILFGAGILLLLTFL